MTELCGTCGALTRQGDLGGFWCRCAKIIPASEMEAWRRGRQHGYAEGEEQYKTHLVDCDIFSTLLAHLALEEAAIIVGGRDSPMGKKIIAIDIDALKLT